jgi:hypothetical protein
LFHLMSITSPFDQVLEKSWLLGLGVRNCIWQTQSPASHPSKTKGRSDRIVEM